MNANKTMKLMNALVTFGAVSAAPKATKEAIEWARKNMVTNIDVTLVTSMLVTISGDGEEDYIHHRVEIDLFKKEWRHSTFDESEEDTDLLMEEEVNDSDACPVSPSKENLDIASAMSREEQTKFVFDSIADDQRWNDTGDAYEEGAHEERLIVERMLVQGDVSLEHAVASLLQIEEDM